MENKKYILCALIPEFAIYSFIGWLYEELCELVLIGKFSDRGFLTLPVCVIYGFFAIAVLRLFNRKRTRPTNVFLISLVMVTVMEYLSGLAIEGILGKPLWDYSMWICNFQGRVSLISSLIFALACTALVFWVHPKLYEIFTQRLDKRVVVCIACFLVLILSVDFVCNIAASLV